MHLKAVSERDHSGPAPLLPLTPLEKRYLTPLRYPGGKSKLAGFIKQMLLANGLTGNEYVEPYAGGASVALSLLFDGYVSRIHINDLDRSVYAFWHSILFETDSFCRMVRDRCVSTAEWSRQRAIQNAPDDHDLLELGFSTFFLNRTNRSGIICSGGMIGGTGQTGQWRLGARYNKEALIDRIARIALSRDRISLHGLDAASLLRDLLPRLLPSVFVYLDPPYYVKGGRRLYANYYTHADHLEISRLLSTTTAPWILTYDDAPEIRHIYRTQPVRRYRLSYTARDRYVGSELMFFSGDLTLPKRSLMKSLLGG